MKTLKTIHARRENLSKYQALNRKSNRTLVAVCALTICIPAFAETLAASEVVTSTRKEVSQVIASAKNDESATAANTVAVDNDGAKSSSMGANQKQSETDETPDDATSRWSYGGEIDFNSRYLWRGIVLSRGAVAQPSAWVSSRDYTLSVWGNIELRRGASDDLPSGRRFNEVDVKFSRTLTRGKWTLEPGFEMYLYPRASDGDSTGEISLRLSRDVGQMTAYSELALDVVRFKGAAYAEIGLSREHAFNPRASGEAAFTLGFGSSRFNRANLDVDSGALNFAALDLSLSYTLNKNLTLRPHATLSTLLPQRLRQQVDDPTIFILGLALESEF